jgi:hypothetical protein
MDYLSKSHVMKLGVQLEVVGVPRVGKLSIEIGLKIEI